MIGVTGATGFIGSHLMNVLDKTVFQIDLRNSTNGEVRDLINKHNCKTVVHLANPTPSNFDGNSDGMKEKAKNLANRLIEIIEPMKDIHILALSSIRVYPNGLPFFTSNSPLNPIDDYGRGKVEVEEIFKSSKHRVTALRCSSVQGVDQDGLPRGLIGIFANQLHEDGCLSIMGDGLAVKDLIHVENLVSLLVKLASMGAPDTDVFIPIGGGSSLTVNELSELFTTGTDCKTETIQPANFELSGSVDNSEIMSHVDWSPTWSVEKMIEESLKAMRGAMQ
ncbi:MAG: NAD-dependent epimerase/dehydratase family protein [Candidatus Poseidoniales archaeon]|nr:NAD-dependent epimerase/dehydratase family protein [Candidatus Poseidoniales archaeon]